MHLSDINPLILLGVGMVFSLLYAAVILFGWARTRRARRAIQAGADIQLLPVYLLDKNEPAPQKRAKCISLATNHFVDSQGYSINLSDYDPYIAGSESPAYPSIRCGNLLLLDKETHRIKYAFPLPSVRHYR